MKALFVLLVIVAVASCSTKQISSSPVTSLRLVADSIVVNVTGPSIDPRVLDKLTREIKGRLIVAGFNIDKQDKFLNLNVRVAEFDPGDAALRLTIGFGAGRGSLIYSAEYRDQAGRLLAKMDAQERFTGQEVNFNWNYGVAATLGGEETAKEILVKEAAKHIVELALKQ